MRKKMFARATSKFVTEIDPEGCLIPVSRPNESDNLTLMSLVIKRNRFWFWQQPKYMPSDFSLNDVLLGEKDIVPDIIESDFLKFNSTSENNTSGGAGAEFGPGNVNVEGKGSSKLAYSFGNLKKQELDLQKLLDECKDRVLDLQHTLLKQTRGKRREVFALVKERIVTTQPCTITEEVQQGGGCAAFLGLSAPKKINVSVKNSSHHSDSNVSVEIPAKTALAYCLIELSVKSKGHFELCLLPDTYGAFEVDGIEANVTKLYATPPKSPEEKLQEELDKLQCHFKLLSELPASTRSGLFQQLTMFLKDKTAISALDLATEDLCCGKEPDLSSLDKEPSVKTAVQTTLELLQNSENLPENISSEQQPQSSALTAFQVLTSALDEMNDTVLTVLEASCTSETIQALDFLVQNAIGNRKCSLKESSLAVLAKDDVYSKVNELFSSCNIKLSKEEDSVISATVSSQQGHEPLILCITICGLASLMTTD